MKKILAIMITFLVLFTPSLRVNAFDIDLVETLNEDKKVIEEVDNGPINESSGFANIVIFIKFADENSYTAPYDYAHYESMFNDPVNISLKNYYLEVSYGQLTIESFIVNDGATMIFYQDENDRSFFEPYDASTNPNGYDDSSNGNTQADREHALLKRAVDFVEVNNYISDAIDLDINLDGDIDSITFMVSGEDNDWNTLFWPHKWNLSTYYNYSAGEYYSDAPMINGKYAYTYTFELLGYSTDYDMQVDVGVIAHETFHLISAPDLYHYYRYDNIEPVGHWGIMEGTSDIPSHMLGYMKEMYGNWIQSVDTITESGSYTLYPMSDSADNLYKIDLGYSNEYLYLEYREATGLYESNLPGSGLLVYRVDMDYYDDGNVDGYYDTSGDPADEIFIFRPGITDTTPPITFPENDDENIDEDGEIEDAALSDNNLHDEMGNGTDILMFYSDGSMMDIKIYNVVEHAGYITFDVYLPPMISLISEVEIPSGTELYLYDAPGFEYRADITNIPGNTVVYYTTDGTIPTELSTQYIGENIVVDAMNDVIKASVYVDGILASIVTKEFNFVTDIETDHNPYGNHQNITWYLDLKDNTSEYNLHFYTLSLLEEDYDYVNLITASNTLTYTGDELNGLDVSFDEDMLINFTTDEYLDTYYGFLITIEFLVDAQIDLVGASTINLEVFDTYTELGAILTGDEAYLYDIHTIGTVNTSVLGKYTITYDMIDDNLTIIKTVSRTVNVLDTEDPTITLNGDSIITVEVGSTYTEQGVIALDNYDDDPTLFTDSNLDMEVLGTYTITYSVTDQSYNTSNQVVRTVNVVDTTAPEVDFVGNIEIDIDLGSVYTDLGVTATDNYDTQLSYETINNVDSNTAGIYTVTYTVTDSSGNETIIIRTVEVIDVSAPVVTIIGDEELAIEVFSEYLDEGITYTNSQGTELTLVTTGTVDTSVVGTYTIEYSVADPFDRTTIEVRTIHVLDTIAPVVTLLPHVDTVIVGETYVYQTVDISDNYYSEFDITVNSSVNTEVEGRYVVEYTVIDGSLNSTTVNRYVNVVEREEYVEIYLFKTVNTVKVGDSFIPAECNYGGPYPNFTYTCYTDIDDVDTSVAGTYEVIYFVTVKGIRYERISYVFVYDEANTLVWYYDKSRRGYL